MEVAVDKEILNVWTQSADSTVLAMDRVMVIWNSTILKRTMQRMLIAWVEW